VFLLLLAILAVPWALLAQTPQNLVQNGNASGGVFPWERWGSATIEGAGDDAHFVVRNKGRLTQVIELPTSAAGLFLAIVGRTGSDRINANGSITGLPYLYGMVERRDRVRILGYLQGQQMLGRPTSVGEWVVNSGVFRIPEGSAWLILSLNQAERAADPQNGSAARFDDIGVYIFPTEAQARALIADWPHPKPEYPPLVSEETKRSGVVPSTTPMRPPVWPVLDPLLPPADPSAVVPFKPEWRAILPTSEGLKTARMCTRRSPGPIEDLWVPDATVVDRFEHALAPLLQGALERSPRKPKYTPASYFRQYFGIVVGGRRLVYVNGVVPSRPERDLPSLRTAFQGPCDGWESSFGAEFDVEAERVQNLAFNGGRG